MKIQIMLDQILRAKNISRHELRNVTGIQIWDINSMCDNDITDISLKVLLILCTTLNCEISDILKLHDNKLKDIIPVLTNPTICIYCSNFINLNPDSPHKHIWFNHVCKANLLPQKLNLTTGKVESYGIGRDGLEYFSEEGYKYCRDCNDGKCVNYNI